MNTNIRYYAQSAASLVIALSLIGLSFGVAFKNSEATRVVADKKLVFQNGAEAKTRTILAKKLEVKVGDKFSLNALVKHLEKIGYAKVDVFDVENPATFSVENSNIKISPRFPGYYEKLLISFAKEKISAIQNLQNGEPMKGCKIEAETLGTFVIDNTNGQKVRAAREFISYQDIKDSHLVRAIISSEDAAFFLHHGINYKGLSSAVYRQAKNYLGNGSFNGSLGGGSSITQQLVKNLFLSAEKSFERKANELFLAVALEKQLSKEQILELYLNNIYLGEIKTDDYKKGIFGVSAASNFYFGKSVNELTMAESATLGSMLNAPNVYEKNANHPRLVLRRERTLRLMRENYPDKYSENDLKQALRERVEFKLEVSREEEFLAQPFVNYVVREMKKIEGFSDDENIKASYVFETEFDGKLLKSTNRILARHLREFGKTITAATGKKDLAFVGSVVGLDRERGQVVLMDGLRLENGEISPDNAAFDKPRDIASSIKPFILAYGLQKGKISLETVTNPNDCVAPDGWIPKDSSDAPDTVKNFFVRSKNKAMVCILNEAGYRDFLRFWGKITGKEDCEKETNYRIANGVNHRCAALSTLEMAAAGSIFPDGLLRHPSAFSRVFRNGQEAKFNQAQPERIVNAEVLKGLSEAMRAVVDSEVGTVTGATAGSLRQEAGLPIITDIIGKSGSSELDFWMTVILPRLVLTVHLSIVPPNNKELSTDGISSTNTTVPLATEILRNIYNSESRYLLEGKFFQSKK